MKPSLLKILTLAILIILPFGYLYMIYPDLPQNVPLHYGSDMQPDRYGDKSEMWFPIILLMSVSLISYLLITNIYKIDPKVSEDQPQTAMHKIAFAIVAFFSVISMYIIYSTVKGGSNSFLFVILGLLFAVLGNFMYNIKPNYFVGMRLPWTLNDDENWKQTHRIAGKVWVAGGIFICLLSFLVPVTWMLPAMMVTISILVLWPTLNSFMFYWNKKNVKDK